PPGLMLIIGAAQLRHNDPLLADLNCYRTRSPPSLKLTRVKGDRFPPTILVGSADGRTPPKYAPRPRPKIESAIRKHCTSIRQQWRLSLNRSGWLFVLRC